MIRIFSLILIDRSLALCFKSRIRLVRVHTPYILSLIIYDDQHVEFWCSARSRWYYGKDTSRFNPDAGRALTEGEMGDIADRLGGTRDGSGERQSLGRDHVVREDLLRSARNEKRASRRVDPNWIEVVSDDEEPLIFTNTSNDSPTLPHCTHTPTVDATNPLIHAAINALTPTSKPVSHTLIDNFNASDATSKTALWRSIRPIITQTNIYIQHSWALTYSHTHHVACRCPNVSSNRSMH